MKILGKYKNGNFTTTIYEDGTMIRETKEDKFIPAFASNMDIKITNQCDMDCPFCHEGSTKDGAYGDIMNEAFIDTLHPFQEVALGGGNVLSHPDLIPFLQKLKAHQIVANITVNQIHFERCQKLIHYLVKNELIYGLGVSLVTPTDKFIRLVQKYPNAVIHVINGVLKPSDVAALQGQGLKMLILGYKHLRRGNDWFAQESENIKTKQDWLYENLPLLIPKFKVVSFDNLAIDQLFVKRLMSEDAWMEFFMGDDSEFTYYIDMVERTFSKNSTSPMNERYPLQDSVDTMFDKIRKR